MAHIDAYLRFNGNCREAMTFYKECLGGELTMQTVAESPLADQIPAEMAQNILHATLIKDRLTLLGSDMVGPEGLIQGNTISLSLNCGSEQEIHEFFASLSSDGQVTHPLESAFWGATFGDLIDKYGISWLLSYDKNVRD